jgi:hypothetical protein
MRSQYGINCGAVVGDDIEDRIWYTAVMSPGKITVRKIFSLPDTLWAKIEDYRFEHRVKTESEAIRMLVEAGLEAGAPKTAPTRKARG